MKNVIIFNILVLLGLLSYHQVFADERTIELTDGSKLTGEIISLKDGVYTLKSKTLGTLQLEESKIRAIQSPASPSSLNIAPHAEIQTLKKLMMSKPEIMEKISTLQSQADIQKILSDPNLINLINAGDISALLAQPQFMQLLENPVMKEITQEITR